jgi:hypothetical protein
MAVFALIVPLGDLGGGGGSPPVFPTHPIAPGGSPPGIWGGSGQPMPTPPIAPGGPPPGVWPSPPVGVWPNPPGGGGHPGHPIAPGSPPGFWGGSGQPMPMPPIYPGGSPGAPTPPIYYPPGVWPQPPGQGMPPTIMPPIALPPMVWPVPPGEGGEGGEGDVSQPIGGGFVLFWHPVYGWKLVPVGGLPPHFQPGRPDQGLPPTAEPKGSS